MTFIEVVERGHSPRPHPIPLNANIGGYVILYGYAMREQTGTAGGEVDIFDGRDGAGLDAFPIALDPGESLRDWFGPQGIHLRGGLFTVITGALIGSLFVHFPDPEMVATP